MRARNIKPGFFTNEHLLQCQPLARILFAGLWCEADREGRLEDRPVRLKIELLPCDTCNLDELLNELADQIDNDGKPALIQRYAVEGRKYIQVVNFKKHQNPHLREADSFIPEPCLNIALPDKHNASQVQVPDKHNASPAESGFLNPESPSLNPESGFRIPNTLSGKERPDETRDAPGESEKTDSPQQPKAQSIPYSAIIEHFNEKTGKEFKSTSEKTRKLIKARWEEGWKLEDFFAVIDIKAEKWKYDPKFMDYLRPQTLFSGNFEAYLQEARSRASPGFGKVSETTARNIEIGQQWLERRQNEREGRG